MEAADERTEPREPRLLDYSFMSHSIPQSLQQRAVRIVGYACALLSPVGIMIFSTRSEMPAFVVEHAIVLLIICIAIMFGIGPAIVAALAAALGDNTFFRDSAGRAVITGVRGVLDAILFVVVAVTVGGLVANARWEKGRAEAAAARERQARDERDGLTALVTHDLATPLEAIRSSIQFARRAGTSASADMERLWVRLDRATARATSLIRTLRDARALDSGALQLRVQRVDLRSLIASVVQMTDRASERHPIALVIPNHPLIVNGDPERLQRVFENLVSNSIKYSPDGGAVEIALVVNSDEAVVTVEDHGIGISPEALMRVFQRGYRSPEARAIGPGLGVGLSISREVVSKHGGSLDAKSGQPSGSMFIVRLPIVSAAPDSPQPRTTPSTNRDSDSAA